MSVKLNRPPKPEESQNNSNFNGKTIPYPGFEPGTSGLAVGRHNHCTIWVGLGASWNLLYGMLQGPFDPSPLLSDTLYLKIHYL
jgi:hypothetical protein